jgi:undecaprenyl-diphosphatase
VRRSTHRAEGVRELREPGAEQRREETPRRGRGARLRAISAWPFPAVLAALVCFGVFAAEAVTGAAVEVEADALEELRATASSGLTGAMRAASAAGSGYVVGALGAAVVLGLWRCRRRANAFVFAVSAAGSVVAQGLKPLFGRPRPEAVPHLVDVTSASFPSGHATQTAALAAAALALARPTRWQGRRRYALLLLLFLYVGVVGVSRLYLGVHYPSDVLGGWAFAIAWVAAVAGIAGIVQARR